MSEANVQSELEVFVRGDSPAAQSQALSALSKLKKLHQAAKDPTFDVGLVKLSRTSVSAAEHESRLTAIAALSRTGTLVKPLQTRVASLLETSLVETPPSLAQLGDPDDRYYVAGLWRLVRPSWLSQYLAKAAVEEEQSERVRSECIEGCLELHQDLASVVQELSTSVRRLSFNTEKPGDSKARRVKRILGAVRTSYAPSLKDPGEEIGTRLKKFLGDCFVHDGLPATPSLLDEMTEEALGVLHQVIRARFSLATSAETYLALDVIKGWYRNDAWSDFVASSEAARLLSRDLASALEMLVRAGVSDDKLYSQLIITAGGPEEARAIAKDILHRFPGLSEDLSGWLSGSQPKKRSGFAAESQMLTLDQSLGELLLAAQRLTAQAEGVEDDVLPETAVMSPQAAVLVRSLLGGVRSIANAVLGMAKVRDLSIRGAAGSITEFSPLEHELVGDATVGARRVRVLRPAVEAPNATGGRRILVKAVVEPLQ